MLKQNIMIATLTDYREWISGLKIELKEMGFVLDVDRDKKEGIVYTAAVKLNVSATTIRNYLNGLGTDPETALQIKETIQNILEENKK